MLLHSHYFVGLDVGRQRDHSAIAILERALIHRPHRDPVSYSWIAEDRLSLVFLRRFPLRTPYPRVIEEVRQLFASSRLAPVRYQLGQQFPKPAGSRPITRPPRDTAIRSTLVLDATGPGLPVVDFIKAAHTPIAANLLPVSITSGAAIHEGETCNVPRQCLLTNLETLLRTRRFHVASHLPLLPALVKELSHLRLVTSPSGRQSFQSARSSQHDDLVFALALAAFADSRYRLPSAAAHLHVAA